MKRLSREWRLSKKWQGRLLGTPGRPEDVFAYTRGALERCFLTVRLFYGLCFFELAQELERLGGLMKAKGMDPLWPVAWVPEVGSRPAAALLFPSAAVLAAFLSLFPTSQRARCAFVALLVLVGAYLNSFGKVNHNYHAMIVIAFFYAFLPSGDVSALRSSFGKMRAYVLTCALALAGFFLCYSISGFWKVAVGVYQLALREVSAFHPEALAYHVSRRLAQTQASPTALARFLIEHPFVGYGPYLLTLYAEFFALLSAARIRTHRLMGFLLLTFHVGSALTLQIGFPHHQLLLLVMAIGSPLTPSANRFRDALLDLPLFGDLLLWARARREVVKTS